MKVIVITGGIGSGKSTFCEMLGRKGIPVYDCDSAAKALYATHPELSAMVTPDIFSQPGKLSELENALFPVLMDDYDRWAADAAGDFVAIESATMLQKPFFNTFGDIVVLVTAPQDIRLSRAESRGGISRDSIRKRMALQDDLSSNPRVNYIIDNSGSIENLEKKVDDFLKEIEYYGTERKN